MKVTDAARTKVTRRPPGLPAGYQNWRRLLFVHWPISAVAIRPLVPDMLSIDDYRGTAYVTLTLFVVNGARPIATPPWLGLQFLETNVRTYVHIDGAEPGVYFLSLDAASVLAVVGARAALGLPYFWASGRERVDADELAYSLHRRGSPGASCHARYRVGVYRGTAAVGTLDYFLLERYLLHVQRGPTLWTVQVHHQPYPMYEAQLMHFADNLAQAAGVSGLGHATAVHFASGVDVEVFPPRIRSRGCGRRAW